MATNDSAFAGSIPALYDRHMGPMLFAPYADDLARRVSDLAAGAVLETACGTGIVTQALARRVPQAVAIVATDLNQPMIDHAASKPDTGRVTWRQADALSLPFPDDTFDAVVCQFGVMFFPDRRTGYREALRVLKPGGRFVFSVWDDLASNPIVETIHLAMARRFPQDPPRFLERTPCGYHDKGLIRSDLEAAGFTDVAVETVAFASRATSPHGPAVGFCQGSPLRGEIEEREAGGLGAATDAAADALAARFGTGAIEAPMQAHVITASG